MPELTWRLGYPLVLSRDGAAVLRAVPLLQARGLALTQPRRTSRRAVADRAVVHPVGRVGGPVVVGGDLELVDRAEGHGRDSRRAGGSGRRWRCAGAGSDQIDPELVGVVLDLAPGSPWGTRSSTPCPRPRAPAGAASRPCRRTRTRVRSVGQVGEVAAREGLHALHERLLRPGREQDHPQPLRGRLVAQRARQREQHGDAGEVVVGARAPRSRRPMSPSRPCSPAQRKVPTRRSARSPSSEPTATSSGPADRAPHGRRAWCRRSPAIFGKRRSGARGQLGVEHEAGVGGVVVGHHDHRALGVLGAQLRHDVRGGPRGEQRCAETTGARR